LDTSRVLITVIISLILIFAYQELVLKRLYPPQAHPTAEESPSAEASAVGTPSAIPSAVASPLAIAPGAAMSPAAAAAPERTYEVETSLFVATFTSHGARLTSFRLKDYRQSAGKSSPPYEMVQSPPGGLLPLGAIVTRDGKTLDDHEIAYSSSSPGHIEVGANGSESLTFDGETAAGLKLEKTFTFSDKSYAFDMDVTESGASKPDELGVSMSQSLAALQGYRDVPELQADVQDKVFTEQEKKLRQGVPPVAGTITYAGFGDRYFLSVFLPTHPAAGTVAMAYSDKEAIARLLFDHTDQVSTRVYMGPKLLDALEAVNPALHHAIDFGWTGVLALIFLRALKLFHFVAPNWGVDILLMTVAIRVAFLPLSIKSQRSMLRMQRLQPQMERLKEKFKDNNEQLQREMMDLYKRNHVNPLGGCAPMALQLPIFIGLYEALLNSVELRHAPFAWWINDLSKPDCLPISWMPTIPYLDCHGLPVLVILMGLSSVAQQWLTPTSPDPNQQRMMMLTPLIFTVMLINFPSGLVLYYFASNMLGVIQQYFLNREMKAYTPAS
jgi:YidC/Oxa1 family membrane protein insertase